MASITSINNSDHPIIQPHNNLHVENQTQDITEKRFDSTRSQWLRAALLGANDGLLSTASLMMAVGAVREDIKTMLLTGIAGLLAGACSMAIGEFVSVYSQYDIEMSKIKREIKIGLSNYDELQDMKNGLPSPIKAAVASACAFAVGASIPLLAAAFISTYHVRMAVVVSVVSMTLVGFGGLSAVIGKAPMLKSIVRILVGGWVAMGVTFGLTKALGSTGVINT